MFFEITTGLKSRHLTPAQRTSSLFTEVPTVFGKTLRRNAPPLRVSYEQFMGSRTLLLRMLDAGAISVAVVDADMQPSRLDFQVAKKALMSFVPPVTEPAPPATLPPSPSSTPTPQEDEDESET